MLILRLGQVMMKAKKLQNKNQQLGYLVSGKLIWKISAQLTTIHVRLGQVRLGQVRLGQVRLAQLRLGKVRFSLTLLQSFSPSLYVSLCLFIVFYVLFFSPSLLLSFFLLLSFSLTLFLYLLSLSLSISLSLFLSFSLSLFDLFIEPFLQIPHCCGVASAPRSSC